MIRDWQLKQQEREENIKRLRELWDEGKASGPPKPFDYRAHNRRREGAPQSGNRKWMTASNLRKAAAMSLPI
jgi:Arc/MetJ-type ribon-helix-helix transcriptional regulator